MDVNKRDQLSCFQAVICAVSHLCDVNLCLHFFVCLHHIRPRYGENRSHATCSLLLINISALLHYATQPDKSRVAGRQRKGWRPGSWRGLAWVTFCVTEVFIEFPAGQPLTHPRLNLLNSVRVYYVPIRWQQSLLISAAMNYSQLY